jgi:ADP-ribose pyrophosphatase YjhB (NUDIX family)
MLVSALAAFILWCRLHLPFSKALPFAWRFCPGCRGKLVMGKVSGKDRVHCKRCSYVNWNSPVSVVVVIIPVVPDGCLLIRRGINPGKNKLALVSGYVDPGETPRQAAVREPLEEVGVHVEIERELGQIVQPDVNQILHFYLARPITETPVAGDDAEEVIVVNRNAIPVDEMAFSTHIDTILAWIAESH